MSSEKIGVVGAGLMGAEIALVFALAGMDVFLNDRDPAVLDAALARLAGGGSWPATGSALVAEHRAATATAAAIELSVSRRFIPPPPCRNRCCSQW